MLCEATISTILVICLILIIVVYVLGVQVGRAAEDAALKGAPVPNV
jgi:hypothetical protein